MATPLLAIQDLSIAFRQGDTVTPVVNELSLQIAPSETLALVGESGSGKSVTALSILRLLPSPPVGYPARGYPVPRRLAAACAGSDAAQGMRGNQIAMIFQEPMVSLNPLHTLEKQLAEVLLPAPRPAARSRARRDRRMPGARRYPSGQKPAEGFSASALRRRTPAGDDRHGPADAPGTADRRRAHHGAGRHRTGANPDAAAGTA